MAASTSGSSDRSLSAAEADIEETRERLAQTIDELLERTSPRNAIRPAERCRRAQR